MLNPARTPTSFHGPRSRTIIAALWLTHAALAGAQNQIAPRDSQSQTHLLQITERRGRVGFEFHYFDESQDRDSADSTDLRNTSIQEFLEYQINGYVYHPRFLDFRAAVKIGLLQQIVDRSGFGGPSDGEGSSDSFIGGYDVFLQFFKEHPASLSLFATRDRSPVLEIFTDSQIIETERYGGALNWKRGPFPMELSVRRLKVENSGADSLTESTSDILEYSIRHDLERRMSSELRYRYRDFEQDFRAENALVDIDRMTELRSHDVSFVNTIYLDRERENSLNSTARWFKQFGTQDIENIYWQERLGLRHTENLRTYYLASFLENDLEESTVRTLRGETGLDHRLFESLDSHFDLHGREIDFDGSNDREYGFTGRFDYRKRTPWGRLSASYGRTIDWIDNASRLTNRTAIDETLTLRDTVTQFLARPAVVTGSIVLTDPTGLITYVENFDYEIEVRGNRTGIRLLLTGRLSDGDPVLADYRFTVSEDNDYRSDNQSFSARHDFEKFLPALSVYYRWEDLKNHGVDAGSDFSILEFTDRVVGFTYRWGPVTWTEEFENYNSNFNSFDQLRSQIEGSYRLRDGLKLGWNAGALLVDFDDDPELARDEDDSDILFAGLSLNGRFKSSGFWELEGRVRDESGLTEETLFGLLGKLGYRFRRVNVESGFRAERHERFSSTRDRLQFFFQLTRDF